MYAGAARDTDAWERMCLLFDFEKTGYDTILLAALVGINRPLRSAFC